jgi:hypothetical protein
LTSLASVVGRTRLNLEAYEIGGGRALKRSLF